MSASTGCMEGDHGFCNSQECGCWCHNISGLPERDETPVCRSCGQAGRCYCCIDGTLLHYAMVRVPRYRWQMAQRWLNGKEG